MSQVMSRSGQRSKFIFHQFRLLRQEFSYNLCASRSERFYVMFVHNGVPELVYYCQGQGQKKRHFKISTCNYRRFLDHLGIKNRCNVFIFGMCIAETNLHNISTVFLNRKRVDFLDIFEKNNFIFF